MVSFFFFLSNRLDDNNDSFDFYYAKCFILFCLILLKTKIDSEYFLSKLIKILKIDPRFNKKKRDVTICIEKIDFYEKRRIID